MKKTVLILVVLAVVAVLTGTVAFAASGTTLAPVTAEQRQQIRDTMAALTDSQKAELQGLQGQVQEIHKKIIDKYVEFGVITQEQADAMKARIDERTAAMKENGMLPGPFGGREGMGGRGGKGGHRGTPDGSRIGECIQAPAPQTAPAAATQAT